MVGTDLLHVELLPKLVRDELVSRRLREARKPADISSRHRPHREVAQKHRGDEEKPSNHSTMLAYHAGRCTTFGCTQRCKRVSPGGAQLLRRQESRDFDRRQQETENRRR